MLVLLLRDLSLLERELAGVLLLCAGLAFGAGFASRPVFAFCAGFAFCGGLAFCAPALGRAACCAGFAFGAASAMLVSAKLNAKLPAKW